MRVSGRGEGGGLSAPNEFDCSINGNGNLFSTEREFLFLRSVSLVVDHRDAHPSIWCRETCLSHTPGSWCHSVSLAVSLSVCLSLPVQLSVWPCLSLPVCFSLPVCLYVWPRLSSFSPPSLSLPVSFSPCPCLAVSLSLLVSLCLS